MPPEIDITVIAIAVVALIAAQVALVIASRWMNPLFLLTAAYVVLAPISAATTFVFVGLAKYGRVYVTLLLLFVGFFILRIYRLRATAVVFLFYVGFYVCAAVWSEEPMAAFKYKGLYGLAVMSGFLLAYSVKDFRDLHIGLRILMVAMAMFAAFILVEFVRNPTLIFHRERLAFWGISANRIGQSVAPMVIVCAYHALYDPARIWRLAGYAVGTMLGIIIIYTGSRGAAGEALLGCFVVSIPLIKRPGLLFFVGAIVGVTVLLTFVYAQTEAPDRLLNVNFESRTEVWARARDMFQEAPVFGLGWVFYEGPGGASSANMHSIYMQTLVEAGLFGLILLAIAVLYATGSGLRMFRFMRSGGIEPQTAYLALGLAGAILAHGVIEAGTVRGSTVNAVMLPFALGLFDRLPEMVRELWHSGEQAGVGAEHAYAEPDLAPPLEAEGARFLS